IIIVVLVAGYSLFGRRDSANAPGMGSETSELMQSPEMASQDVVVPLAEQNDLGQSGTATFTENADGNVVVTLSMNGGTFPDPQPAHVHVGACPNPGAVKYPLANVVDGMSETTLDVTWDEIENGGEALAVNVHKSAAESSV